MPKIKHRELIETLRNASAFSFRVIEKNVGKNYAKTLLHSLRKKGEIIELMKGWYSFKKSPYLITIPLAESYIGLGSAAFLHGAWNTITSIDVLTTYAPRNIRVGERTIADQKLMVRKVSEKMYFGYELKHVDEIKEQIRVSDPEKTLIDLIYFNYALKDEIIPNLIEICNRKKIRKYLKIIKKKKVKSSKRIEMTINELIKNKLVVH